MNSISQARPQPLLLAQIHQTTGLGARDGKSTLCLCWENDLGVVNPLLLRLESRRRRPGVDISAVGPQTEIFGQNTYAMPPMAQHFRTVESTTNSGADLEAYDSGDEKLYTIDLRIGIRT
ncbi:MAG: hypothetical protein Q9175_007038 [Cornicularia normoerica]